jgi:hypothetical protein
MSQAQPEERANDLETAVNMAIAACDGDQRDTIRTLVIANSFLLEELERCRALVSRGFLRRQLSLYDLP